MCCYQSECIKDNLNVNVCRGEGGAMSDLFLVEARLKVVGGRRGALRMEAVRNMLKVSELNKSVNKNGHTRRIRTDIPGE